MTRLPLQIAAVLAIGAGALGQAFAGSNNIVFTVQESPEGTTNGNTLFIDQSGASYSTAVGVAPTLLQQIIDGDLATNLEDTVLTSVGAINPPYLTQRGEGNSASVTLTGVGGEIQLHQDVAPGVPLVIGAAAGGNSATVDADGAVLGAVVQIGAGNIAVLTLSGDSSTGLVSQFGTDLSTDLTVNDGGRAQIIQQGSGSDTGPIVVPVGSSLSYTQVGNNLQPIGPTGLQFYTTAVGTITITQTGY